MAAYGALVSVLHTIDQIQLHPRPPISLDKTQVDSLTEKIIFLQEFLEGYSLESGYRKEADPLEMRIADAAYAVEDVIEFHVVEMIHSKILPRSTARDEMISSTIDPQILPQSTACDEMISATIDSQILPRFTTRGEKFSFFNFCKCFRGPRKAATDHENEVGRMDHEDGISPTEQFNQSLEKVIENMDSLKKEVMEIIEKTGVQDPLLRSSMPAASSVQNLTMVGFDDILVEILDKLAGGERDRQIIPIIGMGGAGKTTLARNIYQHQVVVQHFDFRAWVTISQKYRMREILLELLPEGGRDMSQMDEYELRDELHKRLSGRRYIIIMDDVWDIEALDQLRRFFPDNNNGSRILITTRISNFESTGSYVLKMRFLDKDKSWSLFSKIVFEEKGCPLELVEIGKKIVESCRGLPLSIVVVGGLLAKSKHTGKYWESIAENLNSIVNLENDERCLKILHMSYNELPVYLKPCFLYMGVFSEDKKIHVSKLIKLWVSEGFLKPISGICLEEVANEYLQELVNRNLVLAHKIGSIGNVKYCKLHDLLRDLCLRQAKKERFYNIIRNCSRHVPQDTSTQRRIVIQRFTYEKDVRYALQIISPARSVISEIISPARSVISDSLYHDFTPFENFRLLRIILRPQSTPLFSFSDPYEYVLQFINLRCLVISKYEAFSEFISSFYILWNLQTLIINVGESTEAIDIWNMPQLRHLKIGSSFELSDPPSGNVRGQDVILLQNLQTLGLVCDFKCSEEVVKRIPNIKKLKVHYSSSYWEEPHDFCANFGRLDKLESLCCWQLYAPEWHDIQQNLSFPNSLKKLTLDMDNTYWEDMLEKVGSLPLLQKFKLVNGYFARGKWVTVEDQFPSLIFLSIECSNLKNWKTESSHFPRLEHLVLKELKELEEIPSEIGEISTLKSIKLEDCSASVVISGRKILEKQEELFGEVVIQVLVETISDSDSE